MTVLSCALLVGRRRMPLVFATGSVMVTFPQEWFGVDEGLLAVQLVMLFVACFSLGRHIRGRSGLWGIALINATLYAFAGGLPDPTDLVWGLSLTLGPWLVGRIVQDHARLNLKLAEQAQQLVAEQTMVSERAVADERRRIARELHDIVAHSLSVMVVQAGAAYDVVRRDPAAAEQALVEIQKAGRSALGETGRLLHVLRDDIETELTPPPGAADLIALVDGFRISGLAVELTLDGPTEGLPAGVDLSVYRIVQEGLTNALKYGPEETVRVCYRREPDGIDVALHSGKGPAERRSASNGRGLIGMRERVAVFGGELEAAPTRDGGFLVRATCPFPSHDQRRDRRRPGADPRRAANHAGGPWRRCRRRGAEWSRGHRTDAAAPSRRRPDGHPDARARRHRSYGEVVRQGLPSRVLILTTYDLDELVYRALRTGASGFLLKSTPADRIAAGVDVVAAGESLLSPSVTQRLIEQHVAGHCSDGRVVLGRLTERERGVLRLVAQGRSNTEIADLLVLTEATIKTHVNRVFAKLRVRSRAQAVVMAYECGLVVPGRNP